MSMSTGSTRALILTLCGALLLSGCGFHLRGAVDLPPSISTVSIEAPNAVLADELSTFLEGGGTRTVGKGEPADAVLSITGENLDRRVLSVDPDTGKAREFELSYTLTFRLADSAGKELVAPQTVRLIRDYVFDEDAVIGKSREEGTLVEEMRRDAAQRILDRLNAALRK